jgi:hypothetical protein
MASWIKSIVRKWQKNWRAMQARETPKDYFPQGWCGFVVATTKMSTLGLQMTSPAGNSGPLWRKIFLPHWKRLPRMAQRIVVTADLMLAAVAIIINGDVQSWGFPDQASMRRPLLNWGGKC